jgi:hypothetical protein
MAVAGPALMVREEIWQPKSYDLYEDEVATIYAGWKYWYFPYFGPLIIGEVKDFTIRGNITEMAGIRSTFMCSTQQTMNYGTQDIPIQRMLKQKV